MPATEETYSLVGDLKRATPTVSSAVVLSFGPSVKVTTNLIFKRTVATGTDDLEVSLTGLGDEATWLMIIMDDEQDGIIDIRINEANRTFPLGPKGFIAIMITGITSLKISNNSGNAAGVKVHSGGEG